MSILEAPTVTYFQKDSETLTRKLVRNFRTMLESISPVQEAEEQTGSVEENVVTETPVTNVVFTQAFKKNQYYEQVKTLQTVLKKRGYYDGEIT
ncbi:hypothetical protein IJU97_00105 [bacterium]|nr:hypothetical protein [bacterium]